MKKLGVCVRVKIVESISTEGSGCSASSGFRLKDGLVSLEDSYLIGSVTGALVQFFCDFCIIMFDINVVKDTSDHWRFSLVQGGEWVALFVVETVLGMHSDQIHTRLANVSLEFGHCIKTQISATL